MQITQTILIIAPLDINVHREPIISILEYTPTPNVAPKKHNPLTTIEPIELSSAFETASFLFCPFFLFVIYFVVIKIA